MMDREEREAREATISAVLEDSDAVCACGADPRTAGSLDGWHIDIEEVVGEYERGGRFVEDRAIVQCPRCLTRSAQG